jgi:hypothetical protein
MLTTYRIQDGKSKERTFKRFFHTPVSITAAVEDANFSVLEVQSYTEHIYVDFRRTVRASQPDAMIEVVAARL